MGFHLANNSRYYDVSDFIVGTLLIRSFLTLFRLVVILWRRSYLYKTGRSAAAACTKEFENWDQSGLAASHHK